MVSEMAKKYWISMMVISVMAVLGAGLFMVFSAESDDAVYFPLDSGNQWAYQSIYFDDTSYREDLLVDVQGDGTIRLMVFNNADPVAEIHFQRTKDGLFKTKEISASKMVNYNPPQLSLASKLKVGASWKWESDDKKEKYTSKVLAGGKVKVPAGTFDTILIRTEGVIASGEKYTDESWYAKGVGYVKSVITVGDKKKVDELREYTVKKDK